MEIHLPSNKKFACVFHCYYCHGSALDMALGLDEEKALKLMEEIGPGAFVEYLNQISVINFGNPVFHALIRVLLKGG